MRALASLAMATGLAECERLRGERDALALDEARSKHAHLLAAVRAFLDADNAVLALDPFDDESAFDGVHERQRTAREALVTALRIDR